MGETCRNSHNLHFHLKANISRDHSLPLGSVSVHGMLLITGPAVSGHWSGDTAAIYTIALRTNAYSLSCTVCENLAPCVRTYVGVLAVKYHS